MKANNVLINIFTDLKSAMEVMTRHAMLAEAQITVDAEYVHLIFPLVLMNEARAKKLAP